MLRVVASHDCGRFVNPTMVESQIIGAVMQGLGFGLLEERVVDARSGVVLNADLERYEVPTMSLPGYLRGEQKLPRDQNGLVERAERTIAGGVRPVVVTQYNRIAYSAPDASMRITADHNLMYLAVPWVANDESSLPCRIGPVIAREPGVIIEVKWYQELPRWADELYSYIRDHMVNERPSKFVVALRHLLGEEQKSVAQ